MAELINIFEGELRIKSDSNHEDSLESVQYDAFLDQTCFDSKSFIYTTSGHPLVPPH